MEFFPKKIVDVGAAIIVREKTVFIARRAPGRHLAGKWEFPGGKREAGESYGQCLRRELMEELGIRATIGDFVTESLYAYEATTIRLAAYEVKRWQGSFQLRVHDDFLFTAIDSLAGFELAPADLAIAACLVKRYDLSQGSELK